MARQFNLTAELAKLEKLERKAAARRAATLATRPVYIFYQDSALPDVWRCERPKMTLSRAQLDAMPPNVKIVEIFVNVGSHRKGYK